jgi:hypothetical protein
MSPFQQYHQRYLEIKSVLSNDLKEDSFQDLILNQPARLNNLFMAGLGMGTLFLRMGAVIQMCQKLHDGDTNNDALFMKQVMDNLRETLPSDTNWKNLWYGSMEAGNVWDAAIPRDSNKNSVLDRFVTFRNKFVHQYIRLVPEHFAELRKGLQIMEEMAALYSLFEGGQIVPVKGNYFWNHGGQKLELHPFVQKGDHEGLPYLFQGMYENKSQAKFINTIRGDETKPQPNEPLQSKFQPMHEALRGGAGQVFDHSERMQYYLDCFVGREREVQSVMEWVNSGSLNSVLPIYSEAGMGKGALTAGIIDALIDGNIPVMYHFCGSGMANSLHAILYHFILQGKKMPGMNGAGIWQVEDEALQRKMERLPSRYFDAIKLFQNLLDTSYSPTKKYERKPLVIIVDGLDEAGVANSQLNISDWFYTYNDKDEAEEDWQSPEFVKWIFSYRSMANQGKEGFRLDGRFNIENNELLQPLGGLSEVAVREALKPFDVSEEFIQTVMERGAVI